jgi:hypothetical protein
MSEGKHGYFEDDMRLELGAGGHDAADLAKCLRQAADRIEAGETEGGICVGPFGSGVDVWYRVKRPFMNVCSCAVHGPRGGTKVDP